MNLLIFITTYNRPDMCFNLLRQIYEQKRNYKIRIVLVNDGSKMNYRMAKLYLQNHFPESTYIENPENYGKKYFWKTVNKGFEYASKIDFDYFFMISDDCKLTDNFFTKAIRLFKKSGSVCMNLIMEYSRSMQKMWTNVEPTIIDDDLLSTGWVDMCFISKRKFMELLEFKIFPVPVSHSGNPTKSSGVGMQISQRIIDAGYRFAQVRQSLIIHGNHPSVMHPKERLLHPLISNHSSKKQTKTASVASFPGREKNLQQVVYDILPQVDRLNVYLNGYTEIPDFLHDERINVVLGNKAAGDLGDTGKFYFAEKSEGYYFTIDDDIFYPQNYIETLIKAIERYQRSAVISFHGRVFDKFPISSYYNGAANYYSCLRENAYDRNAHVIGTGVLGYHTETIQMSVSDFKVKNMSDIWFSMACENKNVKRIVLAHDQDFIKAQKIPFVNTIAGWSANNEVAQIAAMNSINWKPLKIEPMNTLRSDVTQKYYLETIKPGKYNFKNFGDIDLCQLTVAQVDSLVARGFKFFKLKPGFKTAEAKPHAPVKPTKPVPTPAEQFPEPKNVNIEEIRKNKVFINKLLTMNWEQMEYRDKLVFYNDPAYYLNKKHLFFHISNVDRMMQGLHAKIKAQPNNLAGVQKRAELIDSLTKSEETRHELWKQIDDWTPPAPPESIEILAEKEKIEQAKKEALKLENERRAHEQYIWRWSDQVDKRDDLTEERKAEIRSEISRRHQALIDMGRPYSRKQRKIK
ncbi:MAG: glycosyltransferase family 2 protein [Bacteroidia bacterium]|nr:glycosyltransferase family 2 protein [Bacteroidia bacterium]